MPKQIYNWEELKTEYLNSGIQEVKAFFVHKYGTFSNSMHKSSIGWSPEKKKYQEAKAKEALKRVGEIDIENMAKALRNIRAYFQQKVSTQKDLEKLKVKEAKEVWKILRIENNLPANIVHQTNVNKVADPEDLIDTLQDESNL